MQRMKIIFVTGMLVAAFTAPVFAGGSEHHMPADQSSPELERIKSLAGRWSTTTDMFGGKPERLYTEYAVTAGGSAVLERIFVGTPQEMISVYYDDPRGKLAMTHYCIMRNRPTLKFAGSTVDSITLAVAKIDGARSKKDPAMGDITIRFKDKNHLEQTCRGKDKTPPMTMEYTRVR